MKRQRLSILGLLFFLLVPVSFAQAPSFFDASKIDQTAALLETEFSEIEAAMDPNERVIVIEGSNLNGFEEMLLPYIKTRYPFIERVGTVPEDKVTLGGILNEKRMVVLLGGPSQNSLTTALQNEIALQEREHPSKDFLAIYEGVNKANAKVMVLSDRRGFGNIPRVGPSRSPLARFMSLPAVIATASVLSVFLMWLWNIIGGPIRVVAARIITTRKAQKAKTEAAQRFFSIGAFQMKYRELGSILLAALVYATASTIAVIGFGVPLLQALKINIVGGIAFYGIRELARLLMCHRMKFHTEYIFWLPGAIFGLLSGYLGNTLNTPGYVKPYQDAKPNQLAFVQYMVLLGTFFLALTFLILNLLVPTVGKQLFGIIASTYAAIEILPVDPCPGRNIWKWKPWLQIITFLIIWPAYIFFHFIV
ncbi:hypothetical protein HYS48_01175 [Candidatus Woesearchaeota archaeon]|nr:hypothetical protein [Candidatus Woesearchaeota archaeon]